MDEIFEEFPETITFVSLRNANISSLPIPPNVCNIKYMDLRDNAQLVFLDTLDDISAFDALEYIYVDESLLKDIDL